MAAGAKGVPIFQFKVLSYGPLDRGPTFYKESVFKDNNWTPGAWLGEVEINEAPPGRRPKTFVAWFRFNDGTNIAVHGDLPGVNASDWRGTGQALALGQGKQGLITVEGKNPKRWG